MASIHKRKTSKFFFGSFYNRDGRQVMRSTKQTDRVSAQIVVDEWERVARGELPASAEQARRVITDLLKKVAPAMELRVSAAGYVKRWLLNIKGTVAGSTLGFYSGAFDSWLRWLGPRAALPLDTITRADILDFRTMALERVTARTVNQRVKALRALFRAALFEHFVTADPTENLKSLKIGRADEPVRRPFSRDELQKVLAVADDQWTLMILLGLETGQRLGDLVRMKWRDVDMPKKAWQLIAGKTGRALRIPLGESLLELLAARAAASDGVAGFVFPELVEQVEKGGGYIDGVSKKFAQFLHAAGLRSHSPYRQKVKKLDDRRVQHELSFHSLRHTARTWLEEAGQPKAVIDALIGHEGNTGRTYTNVGEAAMRGAADVLYQERQKSSGP